MMQSEEQSKRRMKKIKQTLREMWDALVHQCTMKVSDGKEKEHNNIQRNNS